MNKIVKKFEELRRKRRFALMPFFVAGDPSFKMSLKIIKNIVTKIDFLELGFPYSDPLADGTAIQGAHNRALKAEMTPDLVFKLVKEIRKFSKVPITVLVYANLVHRRGIKKFYQDASSAGIDGVLVPDLPTEEARPYIKQARKVGICQIFLATQTTTKKRMKKILSSASGYLYLVAVLGVTGVRKDVSREAISLIRRAKSESSLPVVVGFGFSQKFQIDKLKSAGANGFIIGSALAKIIENNISNKRELIYQVSAYVENLGG